MRDPTIRRLGKTALAGAVAASLSGCASDPAFMEGLAVFADTLAAETARCYYRTNVWGHSEYYCPPAYGSGYGPGYGYVTPTYRPHNDWHDRRGRRDWRRDGGGRDHDRDHRRRDRRGGKD